MNIGETSKAEIREPVADPFRKEREKRETKVIESPAETKREREQVTA